MYLPNNKFLSIKDNSFFIALAIVSVRKVIKIFSAGPAGSKRCHNRAGASEKILDVSRVELSSVCSDPGKPTPATGFHCKLARCLFV